MTCWQRPDELLQREPALLQQKSSFSIDFFWARCSAEAVVGTSIPAGPSFGSRWLRSLLVRIIAREDSARVAHAPAEKAEQVEQ